MISPWKGSQKSPSPPGKSWCSLSAAQTTPCSLQMACHASPPLRPTITCTSTFFSFDFLAGIVRTAVMAVTAFPPNANWTSGELAKRRGKQVQCQGSKTNCKEGWHEETVCLIMLGWHKQALCLTGLGWHMWCGGCCWATGRSCVPATAPSLHCPFTISLLSWWQGSLAILHRAGGCSALQLLSQSPPLPLFLHFPSRTRQQHINGTMALGKPSDFSFSAPWEEASNATTAQHHSLPALLTRAPSCL